MILNWQRLADWCPECQEWRHDVDGWAESHHAETGHTTHRRTSRVETFGGAA